MANDKVEAMLEKLRKLTKVPYTGRAGDVVDGDGQQVDYGGETFVPIPPAPTAPK